MVDIVPPLDINCEPNGVYRFKKYYYYLYESDIPRRLLWQIKTLNYSNYTYVFIFERTKL